MPQGLRFDLHATGPQPQGPHAGQGWTLIEALVVLALVAILLAQAMPTMSTWQDARRVDAWAQRFAADWRWARDLASSTGLDLRVTWQSHAATSCYLVHTGPQGACRCQHTDPQADCQPGAQAWRVVHLPPGVQVQANTASQHLDAVHGTAMPAATWRIRGHQQERRWVINPLGRMRTCTVRLDAPTATAC